MNDRNISSACDQSLWDFALALYSRPQVSYSCLNLQDKYGVDVTLLLWCWWLEARQISLNTQMLKEAQQLIAPWVKNYVAPLRAQRRQLKLEFGTSDASIENLRQAIKQAELLAEKQVLIQLEQFTSNQPWAKAATRLHQGTNALVYLLELGLPENTAKELLIHFSH